ncbi:MAG: ATP-binding protein [Spirochaetaceae bacterium]|jgi:predicted AAA+ superfamily ATPase|nr:ATP-binding protein [Spirochaetaceae bacterium]
MDKEYPRWQTQSVKKALQTRRVVIIAGSRQSGKTTLSRRFLDGNSVYRTLDDTTLLAAALSDPRGFVKNPSGTMIIDEIQKAPLLISEIKQAVDRDKRPGQYLLTGSANIQSLPNVSESLAGRVKNIHLRPFTVGEIFEKQPVFLRRAFSGDFSAQIKGFDKEAIFEMAFRGGYPEPVRLTTAPDRREWYRDYVDSLITRDLKDITNIRRQASLKDLIAILAAWSGKFMDIAGICSSLAISRITIESYINALMSLSIFEKAAPWIRSGYDRIGRRAKLYAADTGLMTSLLGWDLAEVLLNADRAGKLMETFVFQELSAQIDLESRYSLSQYRDRENREIDFIIENEYGSMLGIEVKAGHHVSRKDFAHLEWFKANLAREKRFTGIVLYSGENTLSFDAGMLAVPLAALWTE